LHVLDRSQLIRAPLDEVFAFFAEPRNLALLTPERMRFKIREIDEGPMRAGYRIAYTIHIMGIPIRWVTRITEYQSGRGFADVQEKGPYARWRHEHSFEEAPGGTLMRDRVQYRLPFGILGEVARRLFVARQLREIFDYRAHRIAERFKEHASATLP